MSFSTNGNHHTGELIVGLLEEIIPIRIRIRVDGPTALAPQSTQLASALAALLSALQALLKLLGQ